MAKICNVCNKKINLLSRVISKECKNCGNECHGSCVITALEYDSYKAGEISHNLYCLKCADKNSQKFAQKRYCEICGKDISISSTKVAICSICKGIFCYSCMKKTVIPDNILINHDFSKYLVCTKDYNDIQDYIRDNEILQLSLIGYKEGYDSGYQRGHNDGHNDGYKEGHNDGYDDGYKKGYEEGYRDGED